MDIIVYILLNVHLNALKFSGHYSDQVVKPFPNTLLLIWAVPSQWEEFSGIVSFPVDWFLPLELSYSIENRTEWRNICPRLSKTFKDHPNHPGPSKTVQDCPRPPKTVQDCPRPSKIVHDCPRPSKIFQEILHGIDNN